MCTFACDDLCEAAVGAYSGLCDAGADPIAAPDETERDALVEPPPARCFALACPSARYPAALPCTAVAELTVSSSCMRCTNLSAPELPIAPPAAATWASTPSPSRPASMRSIPSANEVNPRMPPRWHTGSPSRDACSIQPVSTGRPAASRSARVSNTVSCSA